MEKRYRIIIILLIIFGVISMIIGAAFAYFAAVASNNNVYGNTFDFDVSLTVTSIKNSNLIPLKSSLIDRTMKSNNKCIDLNNNDICNYYQVTITNNGSTETFSGYIKTEDTNNKYTTDHLHFKLYDTNYDPVSSEGVISPTVNSLNYFKSTTGTNNLNLSIPNGTSTYYLALWLNDPDDSNQLEDVNKKFVGSLEFVASNGENISASFES